MENRSSKHTPGPWHAERDMSHSIIGRQPWSQVWAGPHQVCRLMAPPHARNELQMYQANALLISKAPDMYELLKAIQSWWKEGVAPIHLDSRIIGNASIADEIDNLLHVIERVDVE